MTRARADTDLTLRPESGRQPVSGPGPQPQTVGEKIMEPPRRIELLTYSLRVNRSTD